MPNLKLKTKTETLCLKLKELLKKRLSLHRYQHTLGVAKEAYDLAIDLNLDSNDAKLQEKAYLAGLLHDYAKELKEFKLLDFAKQFALKLVPFDYEYPHLLHARVGAFIVKSELSSFLLSNLDFELEELEEIWSAIGSHTLGEPEMGTLSQIIFVADGIEKIKTFSDRKIILDKLSMNLGLKRAVLEVCKSKIEFLLSKKQAIHPFALETYNHYVFALKSKAKSTA